MVDTDANHEVSEPWHLRFDVACRRNPGQGGAGAAIFDSSGTLVWTCSHFIPSSSETRNTAKYTAQLVGVQSAVRHGTTRLLVEGEKILVLAQTRGSFSCNNRWLRPFCEVKCERS
uniref:RNase H type-1 domain-containing protein n=1 Tax=Peronospora matthiolae TaxID=2874970 RepID=A0AAV1U0G8_9STRA